MRVVRLLALGWAVNLKMLSKSAFDGFLGVLWPLFFATIAFLMYRVGHDPKTLRVIEKVYTGQTPRRRVGAGECVEIATGAPMPDGADAVVMVEETERAEGDGVRRRRPGGPSTARRTGAPGR